MFDEGFHWRKGICDWCHRRHFSRKASEKAPNIFNKGGSWVGGYSKEKSDIWGEALRQTEEEMTVDCAYFSTADCDDGKLCENCLRSVLEGKNQGIK